MLTPLDELPGATVTRHLGTLSLHVIKEVEVRDTDGGRTRFLHQFISDVYALARAQAAARGGAAVVCVRVRRLWSQVKDRQGQALTTLTGDVVDVEYHARPPSVQESLV